jgi:hypothetical protein
MKLGIALGWYGRQNVQKYQKKAFYLNDWPTRWRCCVRASSVFVSFSPEATNNTKNIGNGRILM